MKGQPNNVLAAGGPSESVLSQMEDVYCHSTPKLSQESAAAIPKIAKAITTVVVSLPLQPSMLFCSPIIKISELFSSLNSSS